MNFLVFLSTYILPFFIFYVVAYGLWKGRNVYQAFVEGAKGGFHTALGILPTLVGLLASLFLSSTETVFYTMSIYFMSVKIKKTRYTLPGALLATLAGIVASVVLVSFIQ